MTTPAPASPAILGLGVYRPARSVGNEEVAGPIDSSDEWIRTRSGIGNRYFAGAGESLGDMATAAAGKALGEAGVSPGDVSLVLTTTMSNVRQAPPLSAEVAFRIGSNGAGAMDTGAGCAGFCYTLAAAADAVRAGSARYVVVAGVERMTDILDPTDRGTAFIFGDGAGAVVVGPGAEDGIGPVRWGSDGSQLDAIAQPYSWADVRADPTVPAPTLRMAGQQVFRWAVTELAPIARDAVDRAGLTLDDIDVFIPHQANLRITDALVKGIGLSDRVVVAREIVRTGNTSAASIPLAMEQLLSSGEARSGQRALLMGFGSGLLYAAQVVRLP
ncbi:MAG: 3-oxoacyl-[acyl-carrier-protein] synthase, KASIII [uncultured Corynebacteriales bacterium]|uniref:3-oxoacyl-[acyl-carrier-protein] synthase, KASIII n=1 Tax=uncultured Mycobacteriales bacterium TaxID=581187 RepID=A0A6J4I2C9_9ACTN|nr:MAG: 3-oxoacyl-[acyl-carrier-protein] synthase, KASIII [uncultured Corynebacteriales bacterium]